MRGAQGHQHGRKRAVAVEERHPYVLVTICRPARGWAVARLSRMIAMTPKTMMAVGLSLFVLPSIGLAQKSQEELAKMRDEKLAHEVFQKANWIFDFDEARAEAKKSNKLIFAYFTRSYAN